MNSKELEKLIRSRGATIVPARGKGGHRMAVLGDRKTMIPTHGSRKELGTGLVKKILKDLGLD
jgi:mRNA interferase HicA